MKINDFFKKNDFLFSAEIFPPKGTNIKKLLSKINIIKNYVHFVNVTDNQRACMRLGGLAISKILLDNDIEPIYQLTCRDRNRLALQSDLLAADVLGIDNILLLSGDHPKNGDHPQAKPVFDLDATQLIQVAKSLNNGVDASNNKLDGSTDFCLGAVINPTVEPLELQTIPMIKKINSGAYFFQTQVAFHKKPYLDLIDFLKKENIRDKVKIIGGVFLLKSEKMMNFMKTIPGVFIPEDIEKRISSADNQLNEGIKICADLISDLKGFLDGVHIMAINSEEYIPDIINQVK